MLNKIFKGFGSHKKSMFEMQRQGFMSLLQLVQKEKKLISRSRNELHVYGIKKEFKDSMEWQSVVSPIRWDLLNPGYPNLIPLQMILKETSTLMEAMEAMMFGVYDLRDGRTIVAMSEEGNEREELTMYGSDTAKENSTPDKEITQVINRLTIAMSIRICKLYLKPDADPELVNEMWQHMADEIDLDPKTLALI